MDQQLVTEEHLDGYSVASLVISFTKRKSITNTEILLFNKNMPGYIKGRLDKHNESKFRVYTNTEIYISQWAEDAVRASMGQLIEQIEKEECHLMED